MAGDAFAAALAEAARLDMPVVAHHPENLPISDVLESGLSALAHVEELLGSSFLREPGDADPDSLRAVGRRVAESGTRLITTLEFFTGMQEQATDAFYGMIVRPELAYVSPERRRAWLDDGHREYIDESEIPWYDAAVRALHEITVGVHEAGGTVVAGTDTPLEFTVPGFSLRRELDHLVLAGLSPLDALRAATVAPADLVGQEDLGRIEVGARADLIVLREDPTAGLDALDVLDGLVLRGRWIPPERLDRALDQLAAAYARAEVERAARARVERELVDIARAGGVEALSAEIARLSELPSAPRIGQAGLNRLGYEMLAADDVETAIEIFRLNVRLHPESANPHDSLGEAYLEAGELDLAEASYRRALELDPTLDSARRGLEIIAERRR